MKCPLCGFEYESGSSACKGCPIYGSCGMVRCPNCGYEVPGESRLIGLLKRMGERHGSER